jgi:hypothetical protein
VHAVLIAGVIVAVGDDLVLQHPAAPVDADAGSRVGGARRTMR